jgi:hypothetical protein
MKHHEDEIIKLKDDWMPAEINFRWLNWFDVIKELYNKLNDGEHKEYADYIYERYVNAFSTKMQLKINN